MGFVRQLVSKATGADQAADAAERGATDQAAATRAAADRASKASQEAAAQTARTQEAAAARAAAEGAAADIISKPVDTPDVQLTTPVAESASAAAKKRRSSFGVGSSGSGVNI